MIVRPDQVYAQVGGISLRFDLLRPETSEALPLLICIHGGGWISNSKENCREAAISFAEAGFAVACPNYRLAPLHPYPAPVEDCMEFLEYCKDRAAEWNVDPGEIALFGESAGGHLAAMTGLKGDGVRAVIDFCGITDVTRPREQHFPIAWGFLEQFIPVPYEGNESLYEEASPLFQVRENPPRFLIVHGEADAIVPIEQSEALALALEARSANPRFVRLPAEGHELSLGAWERMNKLCVEFLHESFSHAVR